VGKNISATQCSGHEVMEYPSLSFLFFFFSPFGQEREFSSYWTEFTGGFWWEEVKLGTTQYVCIIMFKIVVGKTPPPNDLHPAITKLMFLST
jgi:hypothetical protein